VPKLVRTGVSNFFNNIDDLFSGINALLQGKPDKAGDDFGRVLLNTSSWAAFFDPASDLGIERGGEDFGQTFGVWASRRGRTCSCRSSGRRRSATAPGLLVRIYAGPVGFIGDVPTRNALYGIGAVDIRAQASDALSIADTAALDKYRFIRNAYLQRRQYLAPRRKVPPGKGRRRMIQSMRYLRQGAVALVALALCTAALAQGQEAPDAMVKRVSQDVIATIKADPLVQAGDQARIRE